MPKTVTHKVFSMALALLVLLSTFSFKMETRYCGSNFVEVAVFSKVKSCCSSSLITTSELQFTKKSCCNNKVVSIDGLKHFKVVSFSKELQVDNVFELPLKFNFNTVLLTSSTSDYYSSYSPPDRELDFQIEHQVFLI